MTATATLVSVVIPTYRRPALLRRCLQAIERQTLAPRLYEVIVVDDGPDEATAAEVASFKQSSAVSCRYLAMTKNSGPAAARNRGWRAATSGVIAFTDDDCIPDERWLQHGLAAMDEGIAGASGRVVVPLPPSPTDAELNLAGLERSRFVTANCFYGRYALEAYGGFDERFRLAWREDTDVYFTLLARGERLVDAPLAIVRHPPPAPKWGVSLQDQRKSFYNSLLFKKHRELYRREVQSSPPWRYYATVLLGLTVLCSLATRRRRLGSLAGAGWGWLTLAFAGRRLRGTSRRPGHVLEMLVTSALIPPLSIYWRLRGALHHRVLFL